MQDYKRGSHTVWDCKYHIVWITKYRYPILTGEIGERCRELLREIARSKEMTIYAGAINREHIHMLIGIPPYLSVSRAVQYLKGKSSHKLLSEYASLKKRYWGQHLWARGYIPPPTRFLPVDIALLETAKSGADTGVKFRTATCAIGNLRRKLYFMKCWYSGFPLFLHALRGGN